MKASPKIAFKHRQLFLFPLLSSLVALLGFPGPCDGASDQRVSTMMTNFKVPLYANDSTPLTIRAMYMPAPGTCDNPVAKQLFSTVDATTSKHGCSQVRVRVRVCAVCACTCAFVGLTLHARMRVHSQAHSAVPECFVAENWYEGWVGGSMVSVFKRAGLDVVAMTPVNFSSASKEAYNGSSSFTRCAWEVQLGNVDICVGDFWFFIVVSLVLPLKRVVKN